MIERIEFKNFRALRDTALPLGRFTLIVGPNGSGKSTALAGLLLARPVHLAKALGGSNLLWKSVASIGLSVGTGVAIRIVWGPPETGWVSHKDWGRYSRAEELVHELPGRSGRNEPPLTQLLESVRVFSLNANVLAQPVQVRPGVELGPEGQDLAGVLNWLQDAEPERFESLNRELARWLPEFERVVFDWVDNQSKIVMLRTRDGHKIPADGLSSGTLYALALLTLAYLPQPPRLIGLEEPDHGMHPPLLRDVRDAIYRLCYPDQFGESREPVQVVATTHSPYFLDLFKDHPEDIVIANKVGHEAKFERLVDRPDIHDILADAPLGDVWYSGVLGGVPTEP